MSDIDVSNLANRLRDRFPEAERIDIDSIDSDSAEYGAEIVYEDVRLGLTLLASGQWGGWCSVSPALKRIGPGDEVQWGTATYNSLSQACDALGAMLSTYLHSVEKQIGRVANELDPAENATNE